MVEAHQPCSEGPGVFVSSHTNGTGGGVLAGYGSYGGEREAISAPNRTANFPGMGQPMLMSIEEINDLLLNFDSGLDSALPSFTSESVQSTSLENGRPNTNFPSLGDLIEQLSNLQLELYRCLNVVKMVEKQKKDFLEHIAAKCDEVDTTWSERLFATTEKFIAALERYAGSAASSTPNNQLKGNYDDGHLERQNKPQQRQFFNGGPREGWHGTRKHQLRPRTRPCDRAHDRKLRDKTGTDLRVFGIYREGNERGQLSGQLRPDSIRDICTSHEQGPSCPLVGAVYPTSAGRHLGDGGEDCTVEAAVCESRGRQPIH